MTRLTVLGAALAACAEGAAAQHPPRVVLLDTSVLVAPRLNESSGVATSRRRPGVYWTLNDSGDGPVLYATDSTGRDLGFVTLTGARNVDWEDLAIGPCGRSASPCLFVGDIGDNGRSRRTIVVYRVPEPQPPAGPADTTRTVTVQDSFVLRYPDGPHDAEALVVTASGMMYIVTKDRSGAPTLYAAPAGDSGTSGTLRPVGTLSLAVDLVRGRLVTGAALSPDGDVLAVRTYASLHFFRRSGDGFAVALTPPEGLPIPVVEAQGEAVTFDGPGRLVLTSERGFAGRALLTRLRVLGMER